MAPNPPIARRAPAERWRASILVAGDGGPDMVPNPPIARRAPAERWRAWIIVAGDGAPTWPPPSLVAPRPSRGARRSQSQVMGAPRMAPNPPRSSRRGGPRSSSQGIIGCAMHPWHDVELGDHVERHF